VAHVRASSEIMSCITAPSPGTVETASSHALSQPSPTAQGAITMTASSSAFVPAASEQTNISIVSQSLPPATASGLEIVAGIFPTTPSPMMPVQPPPPAVPLHPQVVPPPPAFAQMPPSVPGYGDLLGSAAFHAGGLYNSVPQNLGQYGVQPIGQYAVQTIGQYAVQPNMQYNSVPQNIGQYPPSAQVYDPVYGMSAGQFAQHFAPTGSVAPASNSSGGGSGSVCKHFLIGRCNYGATCKFSHATSAPGAGVSPLGIYSGPGSLICKHWLSGRCTYPDCKFKHEGVPGGGISALAVAPTPLVSPVVGYSASAVAPAVGYSAVSPSLVDLIRSSPY